MSFAYFAAPDQDIVLEVEIDNPSHSSKTVERIDYKDLIGKQGWRRVMIDLSEFRDEAYIVPKIKCSGEGALNYSVVLDDFRFFDAVDNDLAMTLIDYPQNAHTDDPLEVRIRIDNHGLNDAEGYDVVIRCGEDELSRVDGIPVKSLGTVEMTIPFKATESLAGTNDLTVDILFSGDSNPSDNEKTFPLETVVTELPSATGLRAVSEGSDILVEWEKPVGDGVFTDDFEFYKPFSIGNFGRWKTIDSDGGQPYGISFISYPRRNEPRAFMAFNPEMAEFDLEKNPTFKSSTGSQYLLSFSCDPETTEEGYTSDWLISPRLASGGQTVGLSLGTFWDYLGGEIEVWYSDKSDDRSDFRPLTRIEKETSGFEHVEFSLPDDAAYFALEFLPHDKGVLLLDEISFRPMYMELDSYEIYRDGEMIASADPTATEYTDSKSSAGSHIYRIATVFMDGTRVFSENVYVESSAVGSVDEGKPSVTSGKRMIIVGNAMGHNVRVIDSKGIVIFQSMGDSRTEISVPEGFYVVDVADTKYKTVIK